MFVLRGTRKLYIGRPPRVKRPMAWRSPGLSGRAHRLHGLLVDALVLLLGALALAQDADEDLDDDGVELVTGDRAQLPERGVARERLAVRTGRGHRLESVGDRDDLRRQWDVVPGGAVRVTGAVVAFVVREHDRAHALEVRYVREQVGADERVEPHLDPLLLSEPLGLAQDPVGDADLADVVEERRVGKECSSRW